MCNFNHSHSHFKRNIALVEPDLKNSLATVKGILDTEKLVEFVYRRTGKQAVIVNKAG
jgi:hypothetical protein